VQQKCHFAYKRIYIMLLKYTLTVASISCSVLPWICRLM
jgi:hypothetical protein